MNLVQRPWISVPLGAVIVGPSGRVWLVHGVNADGENGVVTAMTITLIDPESAWPAPPEMVTIPVDPAGPVTVVEASPRGSALSVLRSTFPHLELIG